jgi:release factor glutamine methyltransferase
LSTIAQALAHGVRLLEVSSDSPRYDAQLLLGHALGRSREWLIAHADDEIPVEEREAFNAACKARAAGKPIAYILGTAWFHGREFVVNEHVLVPRPETEHLVDDAIAHVRERESASVLDVGVGSGAIACAIAAELPNASVDAVDISPDALRVARENAARLHVDSRVTFYEGDLLGSLPRERRYDVVVANLPYVPTDDIAAAPDPVSFEPRLALDGGPDGLDAYRRLLWMLPPVLKPRSLVLLEAAPPIMPALVVLVRQALPAASIEVARDYGGRERYVRVA